MIVHEISDYRSNKQFREQLIEIKNEPYINLFGETVSNFAVLTDRGRDVSVKFEPLLKKYTLEIKVDNECELMILIKKLLK